MNKDGIDQLVDQLLAEKEGGGPPRPPLPPLNSGPGGGRFDPMEPRVAKLEAQVEHISADIAKLGSLPVDVATVKERLQHLPTKSEVQSLIDGAVDRGGARIQRHIAIVGTLVAIVVGCITIGAKFL